MSDMSMLLPPMLITNFNNMKQNKNGSGSGGRSNIIYVGFLTAAPKS